MISSGAAALTLLPAAMLLTPTGAVRRVVERLRVVAIGLQRKRSHVKVRIEEERK
jgi:hypothetical protein